MTVLLDTHAIFWWASMPDLLSPAVVATLQSADPAVAAITWFELAWLMRRGRIGTTRPIHAAIAALASGVQTVPLTPAIAARAAELPDTFPRDPMDRIIYATALEHGWRLVSKDARLHAADVDGKVVIW